MEEMIRGMIKDAIFEALANTKENTKEIFTREDLADYLHVSVSWVDKNIRDIPHIKIAGTRFRKSDIDEWLDSKKVTTKDKVVEITPVHRTKTYKVK